MASAVASAASLERVPAVEPAPFFADVADGCADAQAWWVTCEDGVRLRIARLGSGDKGIVLLFPGRTEFVEKYGRAGVALAARGWSSVCVDWRGQGLSDRLLPDAATGHVERFSDYQRDVRAILAALPSMGIAPDAPLRLLGHSMGGAIGLRALHEGLGATAVVFTGPMWGISLSPFLRPVARMIVGATRPIGLGARYAPGTRAASYVVETTFADNQLTSDSEMWAWMQRQVNTYPTLRLGGPSNAWVHEALSEVRFLHRIPLPNVPGLAYLGEGERIIDTEKVATLVAKWPSVELRVAAGAKHEVMMEGPALRTQFFDEAVALFESVH